MIKKLLFAILLMINASLFGVSSAAAQTDETFPVQKSTLAEINVPSGALKVRTESVPAEINQTFKKIIAAGDYNVRQGNTEVIIWTGSNYKKSNSAQLTKKLESALQSSGWTYEIGERNNEIILFTLFRETPSRRALVGFFVPSDDSYLFALTEMLAAGAPASQSENQVREEPLNNGRNSTNGGGSQSLVGKWSRGTGSGFIDYTGKTQHKAGKTFTFEFFADGTVEYVYDEDVLSIVQCRTKETSKARGKYTINGDSVTINLGVGNWVGSSSCEPSGNFKKTQPASTITKNFTVKRMDSITRPDKPWILCFDGQSDDACFEKAGR